MPISKFSRRLVANKVASSPIGQKRIANAIEKKFLIAKKEFIQEFENHPVTKEIAGGVDAINISNTLPGRYGNLFSFLGLEINKDYISPVANILDRETRLIQTSKTVSVDKDRIKINLRFSIRLARQEIFEATKLPWDGNTSWFFDIEKGISGFSRYIIGFFSSSRSTGGLQTKNTEIHPGEEFRPVPYFRQLVRNFVLRLRSL